MIVWTSFTATYTILADIFWVRVFTIRTSVNTRGYSSNSLKDLSFLTLEALVTSCIFATFTPWFTSLTRHGIIDWVITRLAFVDTNNSAIGKERIKVPSQITNRAKGLIQTLITSRRARSTEKIHRIWTILIIPVRAFKYALKVYKIESFINWCSWSIILTFCTLRCSFT